MTATFSVKIGLNEEQKRASGARGLPGRALSDHGAHQNAEIEPGNVDQIALVNVLATAQPRAAYAASIKNMGEAALDPFRLGFRMALLPTADFSRPRLP